MAISGTEVLTRLDTGDDAGAVQGSLVDLHVAPRTQAITRPEDLITAFFSCRSENTLRTYRQSLEDFAAFIGSSSVGQAADVLLSLGLGNANALALRYKSSMLERGLSPATVNGRLAALRSLVKLARTLGLVSWSLEVQNVKAESYRDTRGPGVVAVQRMLDQVQTEKPKDARDRAILRLLFDLSLRRAEVISLDLEDLDLERSAISVRRKGRTQKEVLSLPVQTGAALEGWLRVRGAEDGPLFVNFDRAGKGDRLTGTSVYRVVRRLGDSAGAKATPHGLRHTGITTAAEKAQARGYRQRQLVQYSGHKNSVTLDAYIDQVENVQGKIAALVAAELV